MQPTNINSDSDSAMTDSIPQSPREEIGDSPGMADTSSDMAPDESAPGTPALSSISFSSSPHDLLRRLREAAFILYLLDPVRIYNPLPPPIPPNVEVFSGSTYVIVASNSLSQSRDRGEDTNSSEKLKKRLIDALAFICATEREGGDLGAGAAVCIDRPASATAGGGSGEGADIRYTIRIAQNGEVGSEVLDGVRDIVKHLEKFADGLSRNPPAANLYPITDTQVYVTIIRMHLAKVRYHLSEIRDPLAHVQSSLDQHLDTTDSAKKMKTLAQLPLPELKKLQSWLRTFSTQLNSALDSSDVPIAAVSAAFQIKRTPLFGHLEILCRSLGCQVIGVHLGKLGRYKFACKALLHTCQKWPEVFLGMTVEAVPVGDSEESNIGRLERPTREEEIRRVVSKILPPPSEDGEAETQAETPVAVPTVDEAVQALLPTISQEQFTSAWSNLTCSVHAETRIVDFYSSHPDCVPISGTADECADNTRYVGLSRKPCYLCSLYVDRKGENYILGGAEAEKASPGSPGGVANGGGVKRVLDPSWSVSTNVVAPEDSEYRILDDLAGVIEGELKLEVERWVNRSGEEDVVGRERVRVRNKAKQLAAKRMQKWAKEKSVKAEQEISASASTSMGSEGGGVSLATHNLQEGSSSTPEVRRAPKVESKTEVTPETAMPAEEKVQEQEKDQEKKPEPEAQSDDEGDGVKLIDLLGDSDVTPTWFVPFTTSDAGDADDDEVPMRPLSPPPRCPASPPPPTLLDIDPFPLTVLMASGSIAGALASYTYPEMMAPPAENGELHENKEELYSETFIPDSEDAAELDFRLLTPIPEAEHEDELVLVSIDQVLVRLSESRKENQVGAGVEEEDAEQAEGEEVAGDAKEGVEAEEKEEKEAKVVERKLRRRLSAAERDLMSLDFASLAEVMSKSSAVETARILEQEEARREEAERAAKRAADAVVGGGQPKGEGEGGEVPESGGKAANATSSEAALGTSPASSHTAVSTTLVTSTAPPHPPEASSRGHRRSSSSLDLFHPTRLRRSSTCPVALPSTSITTSNANWSPYREDDDEDSSGALANSASSLTLPLLSSTSQPIDVASTSNKAPANTESESASGTPRTAVDDHGGKSVSPGSSSGGWFTKRIKRAKTGVLESASEEFVPRALARPASAMGGQFGPGVGAQMRETRMKAVTSLRELQQRAAAAVGGRKGSKGRK